MPRPRNTVPTYAKHTNGRARIVWRDPTGRRRFLTLPGPYNSAESLAAYHRLCLELATSPAPKLTAVDHGVCVAEVLVPYLEHAADYYPAGSELEAIKAALRPVQVMYGTTPVSEFGPKSLAAVREAFVRKGWSRPYTNRQVRRIVRCFKWAASEELIPATVYQAMKTLTPLRAGKTVAPETAPRLPADPVHVNAALPFLPPHTRAIVELLRVTGMRPAEACRLTLGQIDRSGPVWLYTLTAHKTAHRGKHRTVALGAAAQAVLIEHLGGKILAPDDPVFSPARQRAERFESMRAKRKTKVQPSQTSRKKAEPKKVPGKWFKPAAVLHAVKLACRKAKVPAWSPYMLRHLVGAELREKFSLEHVRAALGHSHASMSAHYAKGADLKLAAEVAERAG